MIKVNPLDEMIRDQKVTFIKMDLEGAEVEALKGSQRIIRECFAQAPDFLLCRICTARIL